MTKVTKRSSKFFSSFCVPLYFPSFLFPFLFLYSYSSFTFLIFPPSFPFVGVVAIGEHWSYLCPPWLISSSLFFLYFSFSLFLCFFSFIFPPFFSSSWLGMVGLAIMAAHGCLSVSLLRGLFLPKFFLPWLQTQATIKDKTEMRPETVLCPGFFPLLLTYIRIASLRIDNIQEWIIY